MSKMDINLFYTSLIVEMPLNQNSVAALEEFKHGIKSVDDYQKYLTLLQNTSEYKSNLFEPLFKTLDSVVLSRYVLLIYTH